MLRHQSPLACLALGLFVTLAQIAFALGVANPEGTLAERYLSLVQHDSYWFANIIDRGYGTTVPPSEPKEMEVSNVAFFPAYPLLASALKRVTRLETYPALLVTAQLATWGFWTYFFLFCQRWELPKSLQVFGALALAAHPAAFYLVAGYSESLFLMTLVGFIYWSTSERRGAKVFAVMHGFAMSATRIVGLVCATFPVVQALFHNDSRPNEKLRDRIARYRAPLLIVLFSMLGGVTFFLYCQVRWGRWDLYLLTQESGWAIDADYGAIFKPENYHFALPPLDDTTAASQFTSAVAGLLFVVIALVEVIAVFRRRSGWRQRVGLYFSAAAIYYISFAGVASVQLESMLRYDLCVHALVILGLLHFLREFRMPPGYVRALAMGVAALVCAAGLGLQGYYVWNFTQGNWVA
jgi:hypothetical protein